MRLTKITLRGYARFKDASCNVDGQVIAFIGPNEAGKSSLLRALHWLTDPSGGALPNHLLNRDSPPAPDDRIVSAQFALDDDEIAQVRALDVDSAEDHASIESYSVVISRRPNGQTRTEVNPPLSRNPEPFAAAVSALNEARITMDDDSSFAEEFAEELEAFAPYLSHEDVLDDASLAILHGGSENLKALLARMAQEAPEGEGEPDQVALDRGIRALDRAIASGSKPHPGLAARALVQPRIPRFVLFEEADRELPGTFDVNADVQVPNALRNLLQLGGTSIEDIRRSLSDGVSGYRSLEGTMNLELKKVEAYWSQSDLRPHVGISSNGLIDTTINDVEGFTAIDERSEGLRAFLAMTCFLLTSGQEVAPILLIDEAERNLHYDAQGDLVRLLTNELPVDQVIYTTHSPGCLPLDLGNGIRVVSRSRSDSRASELSANFWTDEEPGFSRLLFAMGAEAAAFSALNKAILAEGPSEMILLPTLLRLADPERRIDFQVAFGLSGMSVPNDLGTVALMTTYLVDGDDSGDDEMDALEKAGVPESNRLQLPAGMAIEDLLDRDFYLDAVDGVIKDSGRTVFVDRAALDPTKTVAKAVDLQEGTVEGFKPPGHKIVAARIARSPKSIVLSPSGKSYLADDLWPKLEIAFSKNYVLGPLTDLST